MRGPRHCAASRSLVLTLVMSMAQVCVTAAAHGVEGERNGADGATDREAAGLVVRHLDKELQRRSGLRTLTVPASAATRHLPGRVIADPQHSERIAATQPGTVQIAPGLQPGQRVRAGAVLAWLTPTLPVTARADIGAELATATRDEAIGHLQIDRYRIDEAPQFEVKLPTPTLQILTEYRSAKGRAAAYARAQPKPEPLRAPRAGRLLRSMAVAGRVMQTGEPLFEIDTPDAAAIAVDYIDDDLDAASASTARTRDGQPLGLRFLGEGFVAASRLHRALYAVIAKTSDGDGGGDGGDGGGDRQPLVNDLVAIEIPIRTAMPTLRIPRAALLRDAQGQTSVWLHRGAEDFVARRVQTEPRSEAFDGTVAITAGLAAGERVVVAGLAALPPPPRVPSSR